MGECGCGDREPNFWFPGPEGFFYTVVLFPARCRSCEGAPGFRIDMWPNIDERMREDVPRLYEGAHKLDGRFIEWPARPTKERP